MLRSRAALVAGLIIVLAAFAYGVEGTASTTVAGEDVDCGPAISASWLVSGTPDRMSGAGFDTRSAERRAADPCRPVVQRARAGVLSTMAAGALLALLGWTALREPREPVSGGLPRRHGRRPRRPRVPRPARGGRTATG